MYSQNNEETFILNYFKETTGTFLDIGANDGVTLSNTWGLHLKGWTGTLVDASPTVFKRLETNYLGTEDTLIHAAVGATNGKIILKESGALLGTGDTALVSSTLESETNRWSSLNMPFTDVEVPLINFNTLLGISKLKTFDLISIDIEGMELDVLPQMDLKALGCKMLIAEFNGQRQAEFDAIVLPQGYKLIHKNGENLIYVVI